MIYCDFYSFVWGGGYSSNWVGMYGLFVIPGCMGITNFKETSVTKNYKITSQKIPLIKGFPIPKAHQKKKLIFIFDFIELFFDKIVQRSVTLASQV
jgi:hypothetical protein